MNHTRTKAVPLLWKIYKGRPNVKHKKVLIQRNLKASKNKYYQKSIL
jgi:hypothetical protein